MEAMLEYASPDVVFYPDPSWIEEREYRGRDGVMAFHRTQTEAFARTSCPRFMRSGRWASECLSSPRSWGEPRGRGCRYVNRPHTCSPTSATALIGEDRTFLSWKAALEAVGLEE